MGILIALCTNGWGLRCLGALDALAFGFWTVFYRYIALRSPGERRVASIRQMERQARAEANERLRSAMDSAKLEQQKNSQIRNQALYKLEEAMYAAEKAYQSEFSAELTHRRQALSLAERSLVPYETEWKKAGDAYLSEHNKIVPRVNALVSDCRSLDSQYRADLQLLTANSEVAARLRHLRLNSIADADIAQIGASRKQVLASNGIYTAADIEVYKILAIRGFGDVLTNSLLGWKANVLAQFRFDPTSALSPPEQMSINAKFRQKQQQLLAESNRLVDHLESLGKPCRVVLQKLIPEIQLCAARYYQAETDLHVLNGKA